MSTSYTFSLFSFLLIFFFTCQRHLATHMAPLCNTYPSLTNSHSHAYCPGHIHIPIAHSVKVSYTLSFPLLNTHDLKFVISYRCLHPWRHILSPIVSRRHTPTSAGPQASVGSSSGTSGFSLEIRVGTGDRKGGGDTSKSSALHPQFSFCCL